MDSAVRNAFQLARQLGQGPIASPRTTEVEARVKGPIVRGDTVKRLLRTYALQDGTRYVEARNKATSGAQTVVYRSIDGGNVVCKSKIKGFKCHNEWVSVVVSVEMDTGSNEMLLKKHFTTTDKTRYTAMLHGDLRLDVTHFHDEDVYQVEIEALSYDDPGRFAECVRGVVEVLLDSPLYISRKKFDAVRCVVGGEGYYVSNTTATNAYGSIEVDRTTDFSMYHGKYQKPIALTRRRLRSIFGDDTYMTPKLDGVRRFIVTFNGMVYDVDPEHMHVRLLSGSPHSSPFPSILDTELVLGTYNIFDMCVFDGRYVGNEQLQSRLGYVDSWTKTFAQCGNYAAKEYEKISPESPIEQISNFYQRYCNGTFPIDGIVFVDGHRTYTESVIKWKSHITVDLVMEEDGTLEGRVVANSIDTSSLPKRNDGSLLDGAGVYEFEILRALAGDANTTFDLKALRFRDDKKKPNASRVVINNVDALQLRGIWSGRGCVLMRQHHNAVKRSLLEKYARGLTVLDIGSGQGGDVSKWKHAKKVYCVEPSASAISELKERLSAAQMKKQVKVVHCPVSDVEKVCARVHHADVITLFFTINHFTPRDFDGLASIVGRYQPMHVIGIFLDRSLLRFGENACYEITPVDRDAYHIRLPDTRIDQDEHFVGLDQLRFKGYKLVGSRRLDGGKAMSPEEKELSAMFRSFHFRK